MLQKLCCLRGFPFCVRCMISGAQLVSLAAVTQQWLGSLPAHFNHVQLAAVWCSPEQLCFQSMILCRTRTRFVEVSVAHLAQQGSHVLGCDQLQADGSGLVPAFRYAVAWGGITACGSRGSACSSSAFFPCTDSELTSAQPPPAPCQPCSTDGFRDHSGKAAQLCIPISADMGPVCQRIGSGVVLLCILARLGGHPMHEPPGSALAQRHTQRPQEPSAAALCALC